MRIHQILMIVAFGFALGGCSQLMGNLRHDFDDEQASAGPTQGGQWPERGFLSEDAPETPGAYRYMSVGHSERGIASEGGASAEQPWVSDDQVASNRREMYRGDGAPEPSFQNSPNMNPPTKRLYRNGNRATRADFVDDSQNEGSLWASDGQTNYYFTKNKVRGVGDILSIKMDQALIRDLGTEIKRTLTPNEKDMELALAQERIRQKYTGGQDASATQTAANGGAPGAQAAAPGAGDRAPAAVPGKDIPEATPADIDVTKSLDVKEGDPIMAEIVERYPNGNYKIRGTKRIQYKAGTPRLLTLVGVARGSDIGEDDSINAGKLYEYRLEAFR
jgi:flagellar basal body L-ring protein FlgH